MPVLSETWSAAYIQVLSCVLVLVLGLPAFLSQVVRSDLRPLMDEKLVSVRRLSAIVVVVGLLLIWFGSSNESGRIFGILAHIAMSLVFALAPFICTRYLRSMQRGEILEEIFRQCYPDEAGFGAKKKGIEDYHRPLKNLRYLGEFGSTAGEKEDFLEKLEVLIVKWTYDGVSQKLRQGMMSSIAEIVVSTVVGSGQGGDVKCMRKAQEILGRLISSKGSRGEVWGHFKIFSVRFVERAISGKDPTLKDHIRPHVEVFRDYDSDLFRLGEQCLRMEPAVGTMPVILKLKSLYLDSGKSRHYFLGLSALLWRDGSATRQWVERQAFDSIRDDSICLDTALQQAQSFHYKESNFSAFDALGEVLASRIKQTRPEKPVTVHQSFVGFHL